MTETDTELSRCVPEALPLVAGLSPRPSAYLWVRHTLSAPQPCAARDLLPTTVYARLLAINLDILPRAV